MSEFAFDSYQQVTVKGTAYHRAKDERVINVGNVPCRYLMFEVVKGAPLPCDHKMLSLYGVKAGEMNEVIGDGSWDLLFEKTYQIIYNFNT